MRRSIIFIVCLDYFISSHLHLNPQTRSSDDGFYEIARYRFNSNGTEPTCITGVLNWVHGKYDLLANGSIVMTPLGDGYQQIQDPCAAESNFIENYNFTELYQSWRIFTDPVDGFKLHLFQFDGTPVAPQFQVSPSPNMLPTQMLRNVSPVFQSQDGFVSTGGNGKKVLTSANAASRQWNSVDVLVAGAIAVGSMSLMLM